MKTVIFSYNPYWVQTSITVDGQIPDCESLQISQGVRLQEWVEDLPKILAKEYNDKIDLRFIGTKIDFEDIRVAFKESGIAYTLTLEEEKKDVDAAEKTIDKIFKDIQNGPIADLKTKGIKDTFMKAKSSEFEVNVVATMSSGKSTLINALLGRKLMPAKNEATTATIVKIKDVDGKKNFSAVAYDRNHKVVERFEKVTLKDMQKLNDNERVYQIDIEGDIEFVSSEGMSLVLVDTPGPNNSRDLHHQEMTFKMLEDSDKSLVLFVMNGRQLGINDEKIFLDFICSNMKKGGKKTRDRYIFAVNQLDAFKPNPDDDGEECIQKALDSVRASLNERGIKDANIFPVSAGVALEKRIDDDEEELMRPFYKKSKKYAAMRFNEYKEFTHLPQSVLEQMKSNMEELDDEDKVEYYSGICSIEEAIRLYINKYARTTKVCDLVLAFNSKLTELATMARIEDSIRENTNFKQQLNDEIEKAKKLISDSKLTKDFTADVDKTNYTAEVERDIARAISDAKTQFRDLVKGKSYKVDLKQAEAQSQSICRQYDQCAAQINVRVNSIIQNSFKKSLSQVISQYVKHLSILGITPQSLNLSTYSGITVSAPNMKKKMSDNQKKYDESYIVDEEYSVRVESTKGRNGWIGTTTMAGIGATVGSIVPVIGTAAGAFFGGLIGLIAGRSSGHDEYYETKYRPRKIEKYVDYVDMHEVATSASHDFDIKMNELEDRAHSYIISENERLKRSIKEKIKEVDTLMLKKLNDLQAMQNRDKETAEEIARKTAEKEWLEGIQQRVNDLIEF